MSSPAALPFGTQLIGRTEKALNAILGRRLVGTGLTEPQWVALTLAVVGEDQGQDAERLAGRVAGALKTDPATARGHVTALVSAGLLLAADTGAVRATVAGRARWSAVRAATVEITDRLWGDLPAADLAAAGVVLHAVLTRAEALLAAA